MKSKNKPAGKSSLRKRSNDRTSEPKVSFIKRNSAALILLFLASLGLYFSTVKFDYVLDDKIVITDNNFTKQGIKGIRKIFTEESFTGYFQTQQNLVAGSRYRPLSIATFAVEHQYFQLPAKDAYGNLVKDADGNQVMTGNPAISHFINAVLYALSVLLIFRVLCLLFPENPGSRWYWSIPFAASLLFLVHPLHTEVVANIKGRDEILSMLFAMAALYYSMRYIADKKLRFMAGGLTCFFLALLSKENALTFLLIIPLTVYYFTNSPRKEIIGLSLPLLFVSMLYLILRFNVIGFIVNQAEITDIMNNPFYGMSFVQRMATIIYTLGLYVKLLFIPFPLTHDYYPYAIQVMSFGNWQTLASLAVYILLGYIAVKGFKSKDPVSYSILFFMITLSVASNLVLPVGTFMNERFVYVSSLGFCIAIACLGIVKIPSLSVRYTGTLKMTLTVFLSVAVIGFAILTLHRIPAWKNNYSLFDADIVTSANSASENCFMCLALYNKSLQEKEITEKKKLFSRAEFYVKKALKINPVYSEAHQMRAVLATEIFRYEDDAGKLLDAFTAFLLNTKNPDEADQVLAWMNSQGKYNRQLIPFYHNLTNELSSKQLPDIDRAEKYCRMGLQLDPGNPDLQKDLSLISSSR